MKKYNTLFLYHKVTIIKEENTQHLEYEQKRDHPFYPHN